VGSALGSVSPLSVYTCVDVGYPGLRKDIRRRVRQGAARIGADRVRAVVKFESGLAAVEALRDEVSWAYAHRNLMAGRRLDLAAWDEVYGRADEVATLRIDSKLAAWDLAAFSGSSYEVLAGQMVPGFEQYSPGRLLEAVLLARVLTDPRWLRVDWGRGNERALITRNRT
jgi:hypothetical protein